jgi:8-oxo-dGTP diphosphatase
VDSNIEFLEISPNCNFQLTYVVICCRYKAQWVFARHRDRITWEIPGGHIEPGENPDEAAERELREETGAVEYDLWPVCNYSVENQLGKGYGRLYFASIHELKGLLEHEIVELSFRDDMPVSLTHAEIQPFLFQEVKKRLIYL